MKKVWPFCGFAGNPGLLIRLLRVILQRLIVIIVADLIEFLFELGEKNDVTNRLGTG